MHVFLSLYILDDTGESSLLPFLLAAENEEQAMELSDAFVEAVETIANPESDPGARASATKEIDDLRAQVTLLERDEEIALVSETLRRHNPNFEREIVGFTGSVFTVGVNEDAGFTREASRVLRNRMAFHSVVSSLSIELV